MNTSRASTFAALAALFVFCLPPWAAADVREIASSPPEQSLSPARYDQPKKYTGEKISLDFQNTNIRDVIKIIGEHSGKNMVISDGVTGRVTVKLKDLPWDQALDIVLASRTLGVTESGNVLIVYALPGLKDVRHGDSGGFRSAEEMGPSRPLLSRKVFTPRHLPVAEMNRELAGLKSDRGRLVTVGNDIYAEDMPAHVEAMSQLFRKLDRAAPGASE